MTQYRLIKLIGFPSDAGRELSNALARAGFETSSQADARGLCTEPAAVFVCGDRPGWLETVRQVRDLYSRVFLVVAARQPDYEKWLSALAAGADDFCCPPLDAQQLRWLFRRGGNAEPVQTIFAKAE